MMHWQYNPYVLPLLGAAVVSAALAFFGWRRRPAPGATPFVLLALAVAVWSLGYALELGSADLPTKVFWARVQYLGIVMVPVAWLAVVLQYTGREKWLTRRNVALLTIESPVTLLLVWTNDVHGLIWSNIRLDTSGLFSVMDFTRSAWYWVHIGYSYLLLLLGTLVLIRALIRSPYLYRGQAGALLIGALVPWVGNALYVSGLSPFPHLDLTPFAFTLSCLAVAWGLFYFQLLDIVPVARDAIIEGMSDGVIVLDAQDRIVDLNPAAGRIIGRPASEVIGRPAAQILSGQPDLVERYRDVTPVLSEVEGEACAEIILGEGEAQGIYDLRISPLYDRRGRLTGRLIALRGVTERKQAEEALRESEQKYRDIFENVSDFLYFHDLEGNFAETNLAFEREFGYGEEDLANLTVRDLIPERYKHQFGDYLRRVREKGTTEGLMTVVTKDGSERILEYRNSLVYDSTGPIGVRGSARDITERKRAEEALERQAAQLTTLNRVGHRVASILDQQKLLPDAVDAVREDLGYLQAAVLFADQEANELYVAVATDNFWEVIPDEYRQTVGEGAIGIAAESGETVLVSDAASNSRVYRAGHWFSPSSLSMPIKIGGQVIGVLEVEADVPNAFDENDRAALEIMTDQIAIAIENARLY